MAERHHRLDWHEFEQTPGAGDEQGGLARCDSLGREESDTTERLNGTERNWTAGRQASLSVPNSRSPLKPMSIESVRPSSSHPQHIRKTVTVGPFSSCPQTLPTSEPFQMRQLFALGGQTTRVSASTSVLPVNTPDWSTLVCTGLLSLQSKGLSSLQHHSSKASIFRRSAFFIVQHSHPYTATGNTGKPWLDGPLLTEWCLCFLICCLPAHNFSSKEQVF